MLSTGVRQVNHSEVYGKYSKINAFIRIRLTHLFTTLAVRTKKNIRLSKFKETKKNKKQNKKQFNAVKGKEKIQGIYKRELRLILAPGLRTTYSTFS